MSKEQDRAFFRVFDFSCQRTLENLEDKFKTMGYIRNGGDIDDLVRKFEQGVNEREAVPSIAKCA